MPTALSIHKEIEKKKYAESPIGLKEKSLRKIYDSLTLKNEKLPEEVAKKVYDVRDENEKWQMEYIRKTNLEHKEAVDAKLLESMTKELDILNAYGYVVE
mgnify:CR=1 FL=1